LVNGAHHTGLTVASLERSLGFYRDALGCEVVLEQERQGGYLAEIAGYSASVDSFFSPPTAIDTGANAAALGPSLRDPNGAIIELLQLPPSAP
jgi:catechol 2,3-dioxygenase-like lactoylglutathione lyase family enzyme